MTCVGDTRKCEMLSRKITALQGVCWYGCDSGVSFMCIVCGGVGDNDRVGVLTVISSSFSLPLVDYVGAVTISRVNGGSVVP